MRRFTTPEPDKSLKSYGFEVTAQVAPETQGLTGHGAMWVKVSMTPPVNDRRPDDHAAEVSGLLAVIAELRAQNAALVARVADLERQLGLNSGNSGKPPSSDGLKKPVRVGSLRERTGKKTGGQSGHPGKTLSRVEPPDAIVDHFPEVCAGCGAALSEAMAVDHAARQVFGLPEPQPLVVTEHRAFACRCANCGAKTRAAFPEGVAAPVQYGARIAAVVVYLLHFQFLPEKRLAQLMADLLGVSLTTATIASMSRNCAERFAGVAAAVRDRVAAAAVKHLDETGFRIGGKTQWLHIASTLLLTFYRVSSKRGSPPENMTSIVVHDHWKPYYTLKDVLHALCNAHHLRELQALIEIEKEVWARKMRRLLHRACHAANLARDRNAPLSPRFVALIERRYDAVVAEGFVLHEAMPALADASGQRKRRGRKPRRVGHNLLLRLHGRKTDVLRFVSDPTVPFTNTQAERDARMMKLRQKISGGFRSVAGAADFAVIRSVLSTARKQGWNMLRTLAAHPDDLIAKLQVG